MITVLAACCIPFILRTHLIVEDTQSLTSLAMDYHRLYGWPKMALWHFEYVAEASKLRNELGCLEYLSSIPPSKHPGQEYISASILDRHFWLDGPIGRHLALVSKVLGPSILQMTEWDIRI